MMKRLTSISVFLLAMTLSSSLVIAQNMGMRNSMMSDSTSNMSMMQGQNMMGMMSRMHQNGMMQGTMNGGMMNMMQGRMLNMMNNPMRRMMMSVFLMSNLDTLGLSTSQKSKLNDLKSNYVKKMQDMRTSMTSLQSSLTKELTSNSPNMKKVRKLINQRSEAQAGRQWTMIDTWNNMMGVLTHAQKKQFKGMNGRDFMSAMMNNMPMSQMMATCQSMRSAGQGMMGN